MAKRKEKPETVVYATRAHKQHSSLVTTIPKVVCQMLDIEPGDILSFEVVCGEEAAAFRRQLKGTVHNARDKRDSVRQNKDR
ncbi:hypothetical protein ES707_22399 [subsurface metagenome]